MPRRLGLERKALNWRFKCRTDSRGPIVVEDGEGIVAGNVSHGAAARVRFRPVRTTICGPWPIRDMFVGVVAVSTMLYAGLFILPYQRRTHHHLASLFRALPPRPARNRQLP